LVLEEGVPNSYQVEASGNNFLFYLLGVDGITVVPGKSDMMAEMQKVADEIAAPGRHPYIISGDGSNEIGSLGYVACAEEVLAQSFDLGINVNTVVCASGSGGTHAGLLIGFSGNNSGIPVSWH
jgi:D-cysteine desulfhydrase